MELQTQYTGFQELGMQVDQLFIASSSTFKDNSIQEVNHNHQ